MRGFRIFLLLFGLCAIVAAVAVPMLWRSLAPRLQDFTDSVEAEAVRFAEAHDQSACLPEVFARLKECEGLACQIQSPAFTKLCLERAAPSPEVCQGLPDSLFEAALWPRKSCLEIDADPEICERVLREYLKFCAQRRDAP